MILWNDRMVFHAREISQNKTHSDDANLRPEHGHFNQLWNLAIVWPVDM